MALRVFISISVALFLFLAEGINYSMMAPFFPNEAEVFKDLSDEEVGVITGSFDVSTLITSLILPFVAAPELNKFFFVTGAFIAAVANISFGMLAKAPAGDWFAGMSLLCRVVAGVGGAMIWSVGIPLLTSHAPNYAGRITSLAETGGTVGIALGPPLGSLVYYLLGGFKYPFILSGSFELIVVVMVIIIMPGAIYIPNVRVGQHPTNREDDDEDDQLMDLSDASPSYSDDVPAFMGPVEHESTLRAFREFLSIPAVWVVSSLFCVGCIPFAILDVSLSSFLLDSFSIHGSTVGIYFLVIGAIYAFSSQIVGFAIDKGFAAIIYFWSGIGLCISGVLYGLPYFYPYLDKMWYIEATLGVSGVVMSGCYAPVFLILQTICITNEFSHSSENLKLVIGIWINIASAGGRILGSMVFGGVVYPAIDFHRTFLAAAGLFAICCVCNSLYLITSGHHRRIYYVSRDIERRPNVYATQSDSASRFSVDDVDSILTMDYHTP